MSNRRIYGLPRLLTRAKSSCLRWSFVEEPDRARQRDPAFSGIGAHLRPRQSTQSHQLARSQDRHEPTGCVILCREHLNLPGNDCVLDINALKLFPKLFE